MKITDALLQRYIANNLKIWKRIEPKTNKCVYFENNYETWLSLMNCKLLTAKALQEKEQCKVIAINNYKDHSKEKIYQSWGGFSSYCMQKDCSILLKIKSALRAGLFLVFKNNSKEILKLNILNVHVGDLLYDMIIRLEEKYTLLRMKSIKEYMTLYRFYLNAYAIENLYKKAPPAYVVAGDIIYINGLYVRFAMKYNAKIICVTTGKNSLVIKNKQMDCYPNYHSVLRDEIDEKWNTVSDNWETEIEIKLQEIFGGIGDINTAAAYLNKEVVDKEKIQDILALDKSKKNIVIMAHCFSDAPHCGGFFLFSDYYEWLLETLKTVQSISNVNWILKLHPMRATYGEKEECDRIVKSIENTNIKVMPDQYSTAILEGFADAIVTVGGTAGIEFACKGIPCINVGKTFYTGRGFTIEPESKGEYIQLLHRLDKIKRLNEQQVLNAKKTLYIERRVSYEVEDKVQKECYDIYVKLLEGMSEQENNDLFVKSMIEYDIQELRDSYLYAFASSV